MTYSVKVQFSQYTSIDVSGDNISTVVKLVNAITRKFFPGIPGAKREI